MDASPRVAISNDEIEDIDLLFSSCSSNSSEGGSSQSKSIQSRTPEEIPVPPNSLKSDSGSIIVMSPLVVVQAPPTIIPKRRNLLPIIDALPILHPLTGKRFVK